VLVFTTGCGFDNPFWARDHYKVRGSFNADGSCSVSIDGLPMLPQRWEEQIGRLPDSTEYHRRFALNVGMNSGEDLHVVRCGSLGIEFRWRDRELLMPGRYPIVEGTYRVPPQGYATGGARPGQIDAGSWPFALPVVSLYATSGEVVLERVDTTAVVGRFEFVSRRRSSM
jgi:hypothetical protein